MRRTRQAVETRWHPAGEGHTWTLNGLKTGDGRIDGNKEQVKDRGAESEEHRKAKEQSELQKTENKQQQREINKRKQEVQNSNFH